jgi:hypothetical protein
VIRTIDRDSATAIYSNEKKGMLIMIIDPPGKKEHLLTIMGAYGKIDPSKTDTSIQNASRIPVGQPIAIPPSPALEIRATRSDIKATVLDRNTAEIRLANSSDDPGELFRSDEQLLLSLTPNAAVDEMILPGTVPLSFKLTEGSLSISGGTGPNDRPIKLSVNSTSAPVTIKTLPLVSGDYTVKSVGGKVLIVLSRAEGGSLNAEVTGADLTFVILGNASARVDATAASGKVDNFTGAVAQESSADHAVIQMGDGKALITLRAISGNITLKSSQ